MTDAERKTARLENVANIYSSQTEILVSIAISLKRIADAQPTNDMRFANAVAFNRIANALETIARKT